MACYITCALAVAFLVAYFYIMLSQKKLLVSEAVLQEGLGEIYDKIVDERAKIFILSSVIGIIGGIIYIIWRKNKVQTIPLICTAILIFFLIQMFIYTIYPKSDYILNHITNNEEARAWLNIYNQMKKNFIVGFIIGLVGYTLLCWALIR